MTNRNTDPPTSSPIIAVVGLCGTGKSEVVARACEQFGGQAVYFGGAVLREVKRRGMAITPPNERQVREELRAKHGMSAVARLLEQDIRALQVKGARVVIDGLYSFAEYDYLVHEKGLPIVLLAVHSPRGIRYSRLKNRPSRPLTADQTDERDFTEIRGLDKAAPIVVAHHHLVNDGSLETLWKSVDQILSEIYGEKVSEVRAIKWSETAASA